MRRMQGIPTASLASATRFSSIISCLPPLTDLHYHAKSPNMGGHDINIRAVGGREMSRILSTILDRSSLDSSFSIAAAILHHNFPRLIQREFWTQRASNFRNEHGAIRFG